MVILNRHGFAFVVLCCVQCMCIVHTNTNTNTKQQPHISCTILRCPRVTNTHTLKHTVHVVRIGARDNLLQSAVKQLIQCCCYCGVMVTVGRSFFPMFVCVCCCCFFFLFSSSSCLLSIFLCFAHAFVIASNMLIGLVVLQFFFSTMLNNCRTRCTTMFGNSQPVNAC